MDNETIAGEQLVCMIGTDHALAPVDVRSAFSLPGDVRAAEIGHMRDVLGASGVVLLATCNRTELWVSFDGKEMPSRSVDANGKPGIDDPLLQALCNAHRLEADDYAGYFMCRAGDEAVEHLFNVACGLKSAIMAEDQIVSQVKGAIREARELQVADSCLEVLFRQAVTAAKQVKSGVRFTRAYATAVDQAIALLADKGRDFSNTRCLVIGNGEYGRLAASKLVEQGAQVYVTVRQYTHGTVTIPFGCEGVPYADRYQYVARCGVVMSATTSPHYTLEASELQEVLSNEGLLDIVDLAIPRDIDPAINELAGVSVYNIDDFTQEVGIENEQAVMAARKILEAGRKEFWDWTERRETYANGKPTNSVFFPLFVDWTEKHAVFIGGGTIALRRVRTLLPFIGDIEVCAPEFTPELENFAADGAITLVRSAFEPSLIEGADVVFACTNSSEVNDEVWARCKERGILVNVCSDRLKCDFHFPGIVQRENVVVGVNAGGKDHRRVKQLRARIDRLMDEEDV